MNNKRLIEIDVRRCLKALKTHLSWIFMSAILFLAIGIVFALATEEKQDMYRHLRVCTVSQRAGIIPQLMTVLS